MVRIVVIGVRLGRLQRRPFRWRRRERVMGGGGGRYRVERGPGELELTERWRRGQQQLQQQRVVGRRWRRRLVTEQN